ncbi:MAG: ATP-dependent Clp protease ATP-binding subunit ClpX, partial [Campylobacterales bacterium]|nr:ATP-dependent Clp protease ATP-binding subunit ClpX [Campylobacterales bacterium]
NDSSKKNKKAPKMGFLKKEDAEENKKAIEAKELISFGLIPEFIGRIPVIAELNKLSKEDLIRVLKEPKNAIIKQYEILFELDGVELEFTDDALERIAEIAVEKDVGARGLRGIIENIMLPLQYITPSENNLEKCRITRKYIDKKEDVELKYNENSTQEPTKEILFRKLAN